MQIEEFQNNKFYTLLDSDLKFLDFQFKEGLNIQEKFYPPSNMEKNRIVFVNSKDIMNLFSAMINGSYTRSVYGDLITSKYVAELIIPFNNPDFQYTKNSFLSCANMAHLGKYYPIDSLSTYENLISGGSSIRIDDIIKIAGARKFKSLLEDISKNTNNIRDSILLFTILLRCDYHDILEDIVQKNIKYADTVARDSCRYSGKVHFVEKLINIYGVNHNILISETVSCENIELLEYLISKGINIDKAFYIACNNNKIKSIKFLIDKGVDPLEQLSKFNSLPKKSYSDKSAISSLKKYLNIEDKSEEEVSKTQELDIVQIKKQIIELKKQVESLESLIKN
ncbi:ankyrin repeat protein [Moumouvirus australiensis]|uniref:Ankyrin repeat protein n=1 Tax=Moumouvirus australiensis TaxID=2109587 RepID=A0A2P1EMX3_9VIRU|nr:ankyrin repeat protein [Moumouvirus australiensis]AVL95219.1 ankyrin repeat protein [Moumouvirus australiensis]